jgi:hypothetical protein
MGNRRHIKSSREKNDLFAGLMFYFRVSPFRPSLRGKRGRVLAVVLP